MRPPGEDDMMISEAQEANGLSEAPQPVKEGQKQAPPPCTTNTDAVLSTRFESDRNLATSSLCLACVCGPYSLDRLTNGQLSLWPAV
jgi:hypothetical protein